MSLGIYFGQKGISVVETKGKNIVNNIRISSAMLAVSGSEDKVPEEIKTVAVVKEKLRKNKIESREAVIALSSKDLIIRTFGIPVLPSHELFNAINFEAKKYIPFKIEELVSNYQVKLDKVGRRYYVLFVGIKKDIIEKYFSVMKELNIKINSIEYSAFSILRLVDLSGLREKGVVGVINIDAEEGDEAAFTVIENGFPLFSCDIKLPGGAQEGGQFLKDDGMALEKFKTEIRISLDYYNHKFPGKKIKRIFFIGASDYTTNIEPFVQELGLAFKFIDPFKIIGKSMPFSLSFLKGYSSSLSPLVKTAVKVDILQAWEKSKQGKGAAENPLKMLSLLISDLSVNPSILILAGVMCAGSFLFGILQRLPLQQELKAINLTRPHTPSLTPRSTYKDLQGVDAKYRGDIIVMDNLLKKQLYLTPQLAAIPAMLPEGLWLEKYGFLNKDETLEFSINGMAYLRNNSKELEAINNFLIFLRKEPAFNKYFKEISLVLVDTVYVGDKTITNFVINGRNPQVKR